MAMVIEYVKNFTNNTPSHIVSLPSLPATWKANAVLIVITPQWWHSFPCGPQTGLPAATQLTNGALFVFLGKAKIVSH